MRRNGAGCLRRHTFFWLVRKDNVQPPFPLMSKEKVAGGEKKTSQGGVASEQTPHPSSCPPQAADWRRPFRCSSFSHTNRFAGFAWEPCPLTIPLKTTKKGAAAPFLGFSPEFGLCGDRLGLTKRATGTDLADRRGHRNTLRLFRMCLVWKLIHARYVWPPLQKGRLFDFHTSNIQQARIKRLTRPIVRSGNPILRPPEGRSLRNGPSVNGTQKQYAFTARKRYFASPAPFSSISFPARGKRYGPRSGGRGAPNRTAPPAHTDAEKSRPCGRLSIYLLSRASLLRGWRHRPSADAASLRPFPYGRRRSAYRRTGGPSSCAAAG